MKDPLYISYKIVEKLSLGYGMCLRRLTFIRHSSYHILNTRSFSFEFSRSEEVGVLS